MTENREEIMCRAVKALKEAAPDCPVIAVVVFDSPEGGVVSVGSNISNQEHMRDVIGMISEDNAISPPKHLPL